MPLTFTSLQKLSSWKTGNPFGHSSHLGKESLCISTGELEWPSREVWCTMEPSPETIYLHPWSVKGWDLRNKFLYYSAQSAFAFAFWKRRLPGGGLWFILLPAFKGLWWGKTHFYFSASCENWAIVSDGLADTHRFCSLSALLAGWEATGYFLQAHVLDQTFK